ncbi:DEAD-box ATP-dependent RNA helicase 32-like [Helianthus annuus]|uniref:DEAD-box ATP-dependent RNA helicase 32-like n=1 Tax=Helianthus annuus TaxID=4232 RepID=UPI0016533A24|nr:DEAD-box ATP-dependent RNA helicase 32-like [Helianthus annuus]
MHECELAEHVVGLMCHLASCQFRWRIADCPDDAASYIHRGCSTARYDSVQRPVLFLLHTEMKMLERLQEKKIPVQFDKQPKTKRMQSCPGMLAALLAKYTDL